VCGTAQLSATVCCAARGGSKFTRTSSTILNKEFRKFVLVWRRTRMRRERRVAGRGLCHFSARAEFTVPCDFTARGARCSRANGTLLPFTAGVLWQTENEQLLVEDGYVLVVIRQTQRFLATAMSQSFTIRSRSSIDLVQYKVHA
jgi:hypothetical protein